MVRLNLKTGRNHTRSRFFARLVATGLLTISITASLVGAMTSKAYGASPQMVISPPGERIRELFQRPDDWVETRKRTKALLYADHNLAHFSDEELRQWFAQMRTWGISLELEVGAVKRWGPTAEKTFQAERRMWDRALRLGADLKSVAMDEPLVETRSALGKSDDYAVEETARFVHLVRQNYPTLKIGDIEPFPSIELPGHSWWLKALLARLNAQGDAPLDFYRLDIDWVAFAKGARSTWQDARSVAKLAQSRGIPFSLIYWASGYPSEKKLGLAGDDTWYIEVLAQGYTVADAGISPDEFVLESWIDTPSKVLPENDEYTFTRTALDFARKFIDHNQ